MKPFEFWVALAAGVLIVIERHKEKSILSRAVIAAISAGIGYALAPDLASISGRSEVLAVMVLTTFGYLAIEIATGLFQDRDLIRDIVKTRLGGKGDR